MEQFKTCRESESPSRRPLPTSWSSKTRPQPLGKSPATTLLAAKTSSTAEMGKGRQDTKTLPLAEEQGGGIHLLLLHLSGRDMQEEPGNPPEDTRTFLPGSWAGAAATPAPAAAPARPSAGCKGRADTQRVEAPGLPTQGRMRKVQLRLQENCRHCHSPHCQISPHTLDFVPWAHPAVTGERGPASSVL